MNLLIINYEYPPLGGGGANASWNIAKSLAENGHQITVLTSSYKKFRGWKTESGVAVYRCPALRRFVEKSNLVEMASFVISSLFAIPFLSKNKKFQGAIVFFSFPCGPIGLYAKKFFNIPYIVSLRGGDVPEAEPKLRYLHMVLKPLRRHILENASAVTCPSESLKKMAQAVDPVPITVIPNGVDFNFFKATEGRRRRCLDQKKITFLFVGRFQPQKNIRFMLEQFGRFKEKYGTSFLLRIVGDGPMKKEAIALCKKMKLSEQTIWHGWVGRGKLLEIYQKSDCMVNLSHYEGMSNASLEAMACELPLVASNVAGNRDLVMNRKTGYLVALNSDDALSALLKIANDRVGAKNMGRAGRKRVLKNFSWSDVSLGYLALFGFYPPSRNAAGRQLTETSRNVGRNPF